MPYRLDPDRPLDDELRRVVVERIDDALGRLEALRSPGSAEDAEDGVEDGVHEVRKRCKEARGLVRLVRPALGEDAYHGFNAEVRDAAKELSSLRDAHALLGAIEDLQDAAGAEGAAQLEPVRGHQSVLAAAATRGVGGDDPRLAVATGRLQKARALTEAWDLRDDASVVQGGLAKTYRRGRAALDEVLDDADDERVHQWRKRVKYLWYHARLLEPADPDGIGPLVEQLDDLSDLLGEDHDLAVLVEQMERDAGTDALAGVEIDEVVAIARGRQAEIRSEALELGRQVYAPKPGVLVDRVAGPWERVVASRRAGSHGTVERERKFLVAAMPELPDEGTSIRQGYVALDGHSSVRVRERSGRGCTLTVKGGRGAVRTEVECEIDAEQFAAAWALTEGRRIEKVRHVVPVDAGDAEVDVFAGDLRGLVLVEVEFDSDDTLAAFEPPDWFGPDVTDDERYTNASLAVHGLRPGMVTGD